MTTADEIHAILREYEDTPAGISQHIQLDLAYIILTRLDAKGWTQRDLADAIKKPESFVLRLVHAELDCNLSTIGKILHALGAKATLKARQVPGTDIITVIRTP